MMVVLDQSFLYQNGQDIGSRLSVALFVAAIVLLEGHRVVTQQLLHKLVIYARHDELALRVRFLVNQIQDMVFHQVVVGQQQVSSQENATPMY